MLRTSCKKINAAFGKLRDRRAAVGKAPQKVETPEQEAERIKNEIAMAQARGDISTILNLVVSTGQLTDDDYISKSCGVLMYMYYSYVENLHIRPRDLIDMVDGILYLEAKGYVHKRQLNKLRQPER